MAERERVVALMGEVRVGDVLVTPAEAPFHLYLFSQSFPGATLFLEGEPQTPESIAAMMKELVPSPDPSAASPAPQGSSPPGLATLATADMVMRSLAQLQVETFASIIAANEAHLKATLARDADFAEQMFAHRKLLREAIEQLDVVDRGMKIAEVDANFRMHEARARGGKPPEGRTSPIENITFGDICEGVQEVTTGPTNPGSN